MQIGTRNFLVVQLSDDVLALPLLEQILVFAVGSITPEDVLGWVRVATRTQSRTAWLRFLSPIPAGGEIAGATLFMN
jgi:hypothetical protein